jgi:hypothetical protein
MEKVKDNLSPEVNIYIETILINYSSLNFYFELACIGGELEIF